MTKFTVTLESAAPMTTAEAYSQYGFIAEALRESTQVKIVGIVHDAADEVPAKRRYVRKAAAPPNGKTPGQLDIEHDALK